MQKHVIQFENFIEKHTSQEWIKEHIEPDYEDECLGDLEYIFFTGCDLTKRQTAHLRENCLFSSYETFDL